MEETQKIAAYAAMNDGEQIKNKKKRKNVRKKVVFFKWI